MPASFRLLLAALASAPTGALAQTAAAASPGVVLEGRVTTLVPGGAARPAADVAIILEGGPPAAPRPTGTGLRSVSLTFVPRVQVASPGSVLVVGNADDELHTIHGAMAGRTRFNVASPPGGAPFSLPLDEVGVISFSCDIHRFMDGWVVVTRNGLSTVTDADGRFRIAGVPAGRHRVRLWDPERHPPAPAGSEPGVFVREVDAGPTAAPLLIELPPAPAAAVRAPPAARPEPPGRPAASLFAGLAPELAQDWPRGIWVYVLTAVAIVTGFALSATGVTALRRAKWSAVAAVGLACGGMVVAGLLFAFGLNAAVSAGLGLGMFLGTVLAAASARGVTGD